MMDATMASDLLGRQLKGIMFHADAEAYAVFKGWDKLAKLQEKQVLEETKAHLATNRHIIKARNVIIVVPQQARILIPSDASEIALLNLWHEYEKVTAEIYQQAINEEPGCKLWKKLHRHTLGEIKEVERLLKRIK